MTFSKRTNCKECGHPLHLQDLSYSQWLEDGQEFVFVCSSCEMENVLTIKIFNKDGHVNKSYLAIFKEDREYISSDQLTKLLNHLENCEICSNRINEEYLVEVEEKVRFNEQSLKYFEKNSWEVNEVLENVICNSRNVKSFVFQEKEFEIKEDDEFFREDVDSITRVCYYIREDNILSGMVCFKINQVVILEHIWLRSSESLQKERNFFQDLKSGKIKIKLDTLRKIFYSLQN